MFVKHGQTKYCKAYSEWDVFDLGEIMLTSPYIIDSRNILLYTKKVFSSINTLARCAALCHLHVIKSLKIKA